MCLVRELCVVFVNRGMCFIYEGDMMCDLFCVCLCVCEHVCVCMCACECAYVCFAVILCIEGRGVL